MIIEILELAAALEWIALGVLGFFELRSQKRRLEEAIKELENAIVERMAGISGHALSGQNGRDRYEHCV